MGTEAGRLPATAHPAPLPGWHQPCQGRGTPGWPRTMQRAHPAHHDHATRTCELPAPPRVFIRSPYAPCLEGGTFWTQTGGSPAGFYLFYYFSLNICCQTSYRSKLLHSTTSHLLFRIGRIRRVEVKSKHRRAGKAPRCIARQMGYDTVHNLIIKNIYMYISIM